MSTAGAWDPTTNLWVTALPPEPHLSLSKDKTNDKILEIHPTLHKMTA